MHKSGFCCNSQAVVVLFGIKHWIQKERLDQKQFCLNYVALAKQLVDWKKEPEFEFLKKIHSQPLQQTLMCLDKALKEAFDKKNPKRFPRFKKKNVHDSFRYPQGFKIEENNKRFFFPKIGWISYRKSQVIAGIPKNITISRKHGKWFASVQTEQILEEVVHVLASMIDMGVTHFATLSDG